MPARNFQKFKRNLGRHNHLVLYIHRIGDPPFPVVILIPMLLTWWRWGDGNLPEVPAVKFQLINDLSFFQAIGIEIVELFPVDLHDKFPVCILTDNLLLLQVNPSVPCRIWAFIF